MEAVEQLKNQLTIFGGSDNIDLNFNISLKTIKSLNIDKNEFLIQINDSLKEMFGVVKVVWLEYPNFRLKKNNETIPFTTTLMKALFDPESIEGYREKHSNKILYVYYLAKTPNFYNPAYTEKDHVDSPVGEGLKIYISPTTFSDNFIPQKKISMIVDVEKGIDREKMKAAIDDIFDSPEKYEPKPMFGMILNAIFLDSHQEPFYE